MPSVVTSSAVNLVERDAECSYRMLLATDVERLTCRQARSAGVSPCGKRFPAPGPSGYRSVHGSSAVRPVLRSLPLGLRGGGVRGTAPVPAGAAGVGPRRYRDRPALLCRGVGGGVPGPAAVGR